MGTNNSVLKDMDIMKKNQEKISQKLIIMSNDIKKTDSNFTEISNFIQKSFVNSETTNESISNLKISNSNQQVKSVSSFDNDINSKNIKQILNILSSNFG